LTPKHNKNYLEWYKTITKQNYFTYNNILIQNEGLVMGAPSSGLIAEISLQHTEHQHMAELSTKHKIINYFRYVDDILIIYDSNHSDIQAILADINTLHPNLQFTSETEKDNTINYLQEERIIHNILYNNGFPIQPRKPHQPKPK
jgi:hypothetical protein